MICPHCSEFIGGTPLEDLPEQFDPTNIWYQILKGLSQRYPARTTVAELVDLVYGGPESGPLSAPSTITSIISRNRDELLRHGWFLDRAAGHGYALQPLVKYPFSDNEARVLLAAQILKEGE